jgi:16S rRNA (cytidine1402-2'-O)-methyltransferase
MCEQAGGEMQVQTEHLKSLNRVVREQKPFPKGCLIVVGTPIGNLEDFSPRAIEALRQADFVAAEDTRVTLKLLNHFGIHKPLISYYEHNKREKGEQICARMEAGETCALVSDAGMPAISDPGELLVAQCAERGIPVTVAPGPSAVITALAVSGLPTGRFAFEGFLSVNKKSRREHLEEIRGEKRTMVFYEAPHKLPATLRDLLETLGDRRIALVRELTKIHEEVIRTTLQKAAERFSCEAPRGEFVLVVEGAQEAAEKEITLEEAVKLASRYREEGLSLSDAAKKAASETGFKKGELYRLLAR